MKAFLLCAGFGTRLRPLTETKAKPVLPIANLPQLFYPLHFLNQLGVSRFVLNTHWQAQSIVNCLDRFPNIRSMCDISHEEPEILDSAGGLKQARKFFTEDDDYFFVLNGDSFFLSDIETQKKISDITKKHMESKLQTPILFTAPYKDLKSGLWVDSESNLKDAGPTTEIKGLEKKHFVGLYFFHKSIFNSLTDKTNNLIYDVILPLAKSLQTETSEHQTQIKTYHLKNLKWFETGMLESYVECHTELVKILELNNSFPNSVKEAHLFAYQSLNNLYTHKTSDTINVSKDSILNNKLSSKASSKASSKTSPKPWSFKDDRGFVVSPDLISIAQPKAQTKDSL